MSSTVRDRRVYEELADTYRHSQAKMRDWFLVLAADAALAGGEPAEAERLRARLLQFNPHHLLRPFASFVEALRSADVQGYVNDLRRTYPPQVAAELLETNKRQGVPESAPVPPAPEQLRRPLEKPLAQPAPYFSERDEPEPELKVFRVKAETDDFDDTLEPPPRQTILPRPTVRPAPAPLPRSKPEANAPRSQPVYASQPSPRVESRRTPAPAAQPEMGGAFVPTVLFVLLFAAAAALAVFTFARPFLPPAWFR